MYDRWLVCSLRIFRGTAGDRLARVVRPARVSLARTAASISPHELFGCDPTTGIVSVQADSAGRARVWRRAGARLELTEHNFSNWFLATSLELLDHLSVQPRGAEWLRNSGGE